MKGSDALENYHNRLYNRISLRKNYHLAQLVHILQIEDEYFAQIIINAKLQREENHYLAIDKNNNNEAPQKLEEGKDVITIESENSPILSVDEPPSKKQKRDAQETSISPKKTLSDILITIYDALHNQKDIFISYDGEDKPLIPRKIRPMTWIIENCNIKALCYNTTPPQLKIFSICKIKEIRDEMWRLNHDGDSTPISQQNQQPNFSFNPQKSFSIHQWLKSITLEQYAPQFQNNGYDLELAIKLLDETDLDLLGITISGHRKLLLYAAKNTF